MAMFSVKEQVDLIREVFGYIHRFKGHTFVIKIDSNLIATPLFPMLIKDIVLLHRMGIRIVIVPGARTRIDEILAKYGVHCHSENGIRISTAEAIPFIKMAAFDICNRIMTMLAEHRENGIIGNWVKARGIGVRDGINFQHSGTVERLDTDSVRKVLDEEMIPIFPNIGWNAVGKPYNISANELAVALATSLHASKLFYITTSCAITTRKYTVPDDVPADEHGVVSQLTVPQAASFCMLNGRDPADPLKEYVYYGHEACKHDVQRVHIIDGTIEGVLLKETFSSRGLGTMVYANIHEHIRDATVEDIPDIIRIMQPYIENKTLVPRSQDDIEQNIENYAVFEIDGAVHACGALYIYEDNSGEIAGIAVDDAFSYKGIGKKLISYLLERARVYKLSRVFALTTHSADWFLELGFTETDTSALPAQRRAHYNTKRNSLIMHSRLA
jgi:amino-acid N-acetyltransferase